MIVLFQPAVPHVLDLRQEGEVLGAHPGDLIKEQQNPARLHSLRHRPGRITPVLVDCARRIELPRHLAGEFFELMLRGSVLVRRQPGEDIMVIEVMAEFLDQAALANAAPAPDHYEGRGGLTRGFEETREFPLPADKSGHAPPWNSK